MATSGRAGTPKRFADIQRRLRVGTADLHAAVERAVDLPASVASRQDYVGLLRRFYDFHSAVEARWASPAWAGSWVGVGIELDQHRRAHLLAADLVELGELTPKARAVRMPALATWGQGLGSLYVLEGSSLGGRILGPAVRAVLGPVPTGFFDSAGRQHPSPWRAVSRALVLFEDGGGDGGEALQGARDTFVAFGEHVAHAGLAGPG